MNEYNRGWRDGARWAVTWLHNHAAIMSDPHAKTILNGAAKGIGNALNATTQVDTGPGGAIRLKHYAAKPAQPSKEQGE